MTHIINEDYGSRAWWVDNQMLRAIEFIPMQDVTLMQYPKPETISPAQAALLSLYGYAVHKVVIANLGRNQDPEWLIFVKGERSMGPAKILVVSDTLDQWIAELADWEGRNAPDPS